MPNIDLILGADHGRRRSVRTEPTQRRSTQRLDALLDAAAGIVDELGFERLTTQMVAERAGASIGTVYRYFPDRVAVLHALRERSVRRYRERLAETMEQAELAANGRHRFQQIGVGFAHLTAEEFHDPEDVASGENRAAESRVQMFRRGDRGSRKI